MTNLADLKRDFMYDPENKAVYNALAAEFDLARNLITARAVSGLSQAEGARQNISIAKLTSYADAIGAKLTRAEPIYSKLD